MKMEEDFKNLTRKLEKITTELETAFNIFMEEQAEVQRMIDDLEDRIWRLENES